MSAITPPTQRIGNSFGESGRPRPAITPWPLRCRKTTPELTSRDRRYQEPSPASPCCFGTSSGMVASTRPSQTVPISVRCSQGKRCKDKEKQNFVPRVSLGSCWGSSLGVRENLRGFSYPHGHVVGMPGGCPTCAARCGRGRLSEMGRGWGIAKICLGCPSRKGTCCTGAVGDRCGMIPLRSTAAIDLGMQGRNGLLAVFEHGQGSGKPGGRVRKTFRQCRGNENGCHRGSFAVCGGAMMRGLGWSSGVDSSKSWSGEIDGIMDWLSGSLDGGNAQTINFPRDSMIR
jgi:hypothetical protein